MGAARAAGRAPALHPDYSGLVIPPNIAPLNFVVHEPGDRFRVRLSGSAGQPLEVRHYGTAPGRFDLFEDDGKTFDYERGRYRLRRLSVEAAAGGRLAIRETVVKDGAPVATESLRNRREVGLPEAPS